NWTGAKQYSSSDFRDDVTAGVISLEEAYYAANKSTWGDDSGEIRELLLAGSRYGADDKIKNALMIYQPKESKNADEKAINGPTAYGYTSTSFSLEKSSYYKLTVDVLTYKIEGKNDGDTPGARIYVSSNTYAEFAGINTNGKWETYEIYIETSPTASTSLSLMLGLGKYQSYFKTGLTTGYAFFDNVELTKIEDDKSTSKVEGLEQFNAAHKAQLESSAVLDGKHVTTSTLKVPNGNFDFGSTSLSTSGAPSSWSLVTGNSGKDDPAPTSLGYNGIVDLTTLSSKYTDLAKEITLASQGTTTDNHIKNPYNPAESLEKIAGNIATAPNRIGSNVFMLSSQHMTAQGIKSSRTITIEKNKIYALSVKLYTVAIHGAGVSLILSGSDGKDIVIKGIAANKTPEVLLGTAVIDLDNKSYHNGDNPGLTSDGWQTYTFYIQGNQFKDYSYNMTIWLGTEGTNSNTSVKYTSYGSGSSSSETTTYKANGTFSNGFVFIDDLALEEITQGAFNSALDNEANRLGDKNQTLDCSTQNGANYRGIIVDLTSTNILGEGDDYILNKRAEDSSLEGVTTVGAGAPFGWNSQFDATDKENPVVTDIVSQGVVNIEEEKVFNGNGAYPSLPYDLVSKTAYEISAKEYTRYEVETGNITIAANKFYRLSLWVKTIDVSSASGAYISLINKDDEDAELTSFTKVNTKDYDEYYNDWCEITIVIRGAENKNTNAALRFALGSGNRWASTLTDGSMYVANLSMTDITYANFNDTTTSTYVKSVDLTESLNYTFSNGEFDNYDHDDENLEGGVALNEQHFAATPEDWTISDSTQAINAKEDEETNEVTSIFEVVKALNTTS
ncbi:MAG: hypothetical protein K2G31_04550, partial [Clostridia bacterium]|nr:hypothetical protein [Clostridia bacterium]